MSGGAKDIDTFYKILYDIFDERGADSEATLTLSANDLTMKLTEINDDEEKQERLFSLKISGKPATQIGQQLEDELVAGSITKCNNLQKTTTPFRGRRNLLNPIDS